MAQINELKRPDHHDNQIDVIKEVYSNLYPMEENCLNAREMLLKIRAEIDTLRQKCKFSALVDRDSIRVC